jgi:hypothetical protein
MALTKEELIQKWKTVTDFNQRDQILEQMTSRGLFPQASVDLLESENELYPDTSDPRFLPKLMKKQEFAENKQLSILELLQRGENPCDPTQEFELSPVQRFIGQFLSPKTPYNSALLYHGVGVGKSCAAITVAESFLNAFPRKQVIIVAPPNIQPGFERTIFNEERLVIGESEKEPNTFQGCTGDTYLRLSGMEFVRDKKTILSKISKLRAKRYQMFGYVQFYNYIRELLDKNVRKSLTGDARVREEIAVLRRKFSGRLVIIDEAHNLRDIPGEAEEENLDAPGGLMELNESLAGKKLTPFLKRVFDATDGMKLLLLTATPMYNSYREILFLFNLLLLNDKKAILREEDIFQRNGEFTEGGEALLGRVASVYLSFMRGENPLSFPIRLTPEGVSEVTEWPIQTPNGVSISEDERNHMLNLPFVSCRFTGEAQNIYQQLAMDTVRESGLGLASVDLMIQAGNWLFPGSGTGDVRARIREFGFSSTFTEGTEGTLKVYRSAAGVDPSWLLEERISQYSPKAALILRRLKTTRGVAFIYSRFVKSGALTLALALEANGYTLVGRDTSFFKNGILGDEGRQCAMCSRKEKGHAGAGHSFIPAKYVLLTGRDEYSPNNKLSVDLARGDANKYGQQVKVVLGSQVASEGIDLRFIREVFVFDSWYHLNKLEQVIGRAIRMCSHALLDEKERNCTINLLVLTFSNEVATETIDMYQYRMGFRKAVQVGKVTRALKRYALDCNLNNDAIQIAGLPPRDQIDAQGKLRPSVDINDMPFTSVCDWIETCEYTCAIKVDIDLRDLDTSTYDEYAAKWRESKIKDYIRARFEEQPFYRFEELENLMVAQGVPRIALASLLSDIVGNRSFRIRMKGQEGYIIYKNGFYLFQPELVADTSLPLALRLASYPVKRDSYEPRSVPVVPLNKKTETGTGKETGTETETATEKETEKGEEKEEEKEEDEISDYTPFWSSIKKWSLDLINGSATTVLPTEVINAARSRYGSNKNELKRVMFEIEMIQWLYVTVREKESYRKLFGQIVLEVIWDKYLRHGEQFKIYTTENGSADELTKRTWIENVVSSKMAGGFKTGFRVLNPSTGKLIYHCPTGPCDPSLIKVFEEDPSDPLKGLVANTNTTAKIYGTVNFKRGNFVFKTNEAVEPTKKKPDVGSECSIVSTISAHFTLLKTIGAMIEPILGTDLDLNEGILEKSPLRTFTNQIRACALTELVLRLLDKLKVKDKRWFYRPIATLKTGHRGIMRK